MLRCSYNKNYFIPTILQNHNEKKMYLYIKKKLKLKLHIYIIMQSHINTIQIYVY